MSWDKVFAGLASHPGGATPALPAPGPSSVPQSIGFWSYNDGTYCTVRISWADWLRLPEVLVTVRI
ncbi:MAG TPA: hypothetical protein VFZ27_19005 [Terriglobia bacterium]|nr:hypothetical protein [Terriglobia bacterium]